MTRKMEAGKSGRAEEEFLEGNRFALGMKRSSVWNAECVFRQMRAFHKCSRVLRSQRDLGSHFNTWEVFWRFLSGSGKGIAIIL